MTVRDEQSLFAGSNIHDEYPVVLRCDFVFGPIQSLRVTSHQTQSRQATVIYGKKGRTVCCDATVTDRCVIEFVFVNAFFLFNVVQYGKHFACLDISVVKEELCFRFQWVPIEHCSLLWIPRVRFVHSNNLVVMMGINKNHRSELFGRRQTIDSVDFKAQNISTAGIPRDRLALADIAKEMMLRAGGKLFDFQFD